MRMLTDINGRAMDSCWTVAAEPLMYARERPLTSTTRLAGRDRAS